MRTRGVCTSLVETAVSGYRTPARAVWPFLRFADLLEQIGPPRARAVWPFLRFADLLEQIGPPRAGGVGGLRVPGAYPSRVRGT